MEYLKRRVHVLDEGFVLPEKDRIVLKQLVGRFSNDAYADYARYFFYEFTSVRRIEC